MPTKAVLVQARQIRDARLDALRADVDGARDARAAGLDGVAEASRAIDGITDQLLTDTERATRQEDAQRHLADARDAREREAAKRAGVQRALDETGEAWRQTWAASGQQPRGAAEMLRWRERLDEIIARLEMVDRQRVGIDALASALDAGKTATVSFLEGTGLRPDPAPPAGVLYREAKGRFEQLQDAWADAKARVVAKTRITRDRIAARIAELRRQWPQTMQAIGQPSEATPAQANAALTRLATRQTLQNEQAALRRQLGEIADGHDEDALSREREGIDLDGLRAGIDSETVHQAQLLKDITDASAAHRQPQQELDVLTKGRDAAGAATRRNEAEAEMLTIAEGWLLRSAASLLARTTIELHRAKVQDPTIARAGGLFALATADAFAGLAIDYSEQDQPMLVVRRAEGEWVPVFGLSEGTRDQLYLALRLALLERRTSEPMPFIGDDLLASFDETRTLATLRLLAATGRQRQIIVFTHHSHAASLTDCAVDLINL